MSNIFWLVPGLCLLHFFSTPFFFIKVTNPARRLLIYILYTAIIVRGLAWAIKFTAISTGRPFAGFVFALPLGDQATINDRMIWLGGFFTVLPFYFVLFFAAVSIFSAYIYHTSRFRRQRL